MTGWRARVGSWLAAAIATAAVHTVAAQPPRKLPPLENVRLLKGWDGAQVREEMRRMSEALGVKCDHCHVQGNFASDEKRPKQTARRMLELTMTLNGEYFAAHAPADGESRLGRVTCYTCHRGSAIPPSGAWAGVAR
ncbi:MAG: c-type cytochrome [Vicinamibacterales bacterium]